MAQTARSSAATHESTVAHTAHQTATDQISYTIAVALAAAEGVPVTELEVCLADAVDVDALTTLVAQTDATTDLSLSFSLAEYTIHVEGTGDVTVVESQ